MKIYLKKVVKNKVSGLIVFCFFSGMSVNAQSQKIQMMEGAFIQGGETSLEAFGVTKPESLLVFNSKATTKYARITFMKFKLPQGVENVKSIEFILQIKVFKDKTFPDAKFDLDVQAVPNSKWSSQSITFSNAPKLGEILGSAQINQAIDEKKYERVIIKLDAEAVNQLIKDSRKGVITIALANNTSSASGASIGKDTFLTIE